MLKAIHQNKFKMSIIPTKNIFFFGRGIWQSNLALKVAQSSFWVTIPLNFKQLVYHSEQPNRKSIVTAVLEKDESFT